MMRVIAGRAKGHHLKVPKGTPTRPATDLVRGAIFSILETTASDWSRVLDLFSGSGALGIEALSRGAAHAVFLERNQGALACLTANIETLGVADRTTVHRKSAFSFPAIAAQGEPFDLVFADPPFRQFESGAGRRKLEDLLMALPVRPGGLLVVEHRAGALGDFSPGGFVLDELRKWGSTGMAIYRRA